MQHIRLRIYKFLIVLGLISTVFVPYQAYALAIPGDADLASFLSRLVLDDGGSIKKCIAVALLADTQYIIKEDEQ